MRTCCRLAALAGLILSLAAGSAAAATYYVDFEGGADANDGLSAEAPWKHSPGDAAAEGKPKEAKLVPGDKVIFKGGVHYRGMIEIPASGTPEQAVIYDGNTAGTFGRGRAIIDGSEPLVGWRKCASADDAGGNPNWEHLYVAHAPAGTTLFTLNLCEADELLRISQDPNPVDAFFDDDVRTFRRTARPFPRTLTSIETVADPKTEVSRPHPLFLMVDGRPETAGVVKPLAGAEITLKLPREVTVQSFAVANSAKNEPMAREVSFSAGERELLRCELEAEAGLQHFKLDAPATFSEVTFRVHSVHPDKRAWGAVAEIQAFDDQGRNVLQSVMTTEYVDAEYFTQEDPHYWDSAVFMLYLEPALIYHLNVLGYDSGQHKLITEPCMRSRPARDLKEDRGRFSMLNAVRIIDTPGEYAFSRQAEADGRHKVTLWPRKPGPDGPRDITFSRRDFGIRMGRRQFVTVQGFRVQQQSGGETAGLFVGGCRNVTLRDNEVLRVRSDNKGVAVLAIDSLRVVVEGNRVGFSPNCSGIVFYRSIESLARGNVLEANGWNGIESNNSRGSRFTGNTVTGHMGFQASAIVVHLDSRDATVEGNRVALSNCGLKVQEAQNVTACCNVFDRCGADACVNLWPGPGMANVKILNNLMRLRADTSSPWGAALVGGNEELRSLVVRNNIIEGLAGSLQGEFSHNIYTRWGPGQEKRKLGLGELHEPDLKKLFLDPEKGDYRPRPGSPAIDAGTDAGVEKDMDGTAVPQGKAPDIGPYEFKAE